MKSHILRWFITSYLEEMSKEIWAKDYIEKIGKGQWNYVTRKLKLPCCSRKSNLCFSMAISFLMAVIWFLITVLSFASIVGESKSLSSPTIASFNFRISSRISSRVIIASQFHQFAESSKSRNVKSGFPKCEGNVQKTSFLPLSQAKWIQISKSLKKLTLGQFWEGQSKCRKHQIPPDYGWWKRRFVPWNLSKSNSELNNRDRNCVTTKDDGIIKNIEIAY